MSEKVEKAIKAIISILGTGLLVLLLLGSTTKPDMFAVGCFASVATMGLYVAAGYLITGVQKLLRKIKQLF